MNDVADTCRFGNSHFDVFFLLYKKKNYTNYSGCSNLLISENINFTFEYFSIKDILNNYVIIGLHVLINKSMSKLIKTLFHYLL